MSLRSIFRGIWFFIERPKLAIFITGVLSVIPAAIFIFISVRYVLGNLSPVDLNSADCDFASITDYSRVSGNAYTAWGYFAIKSDGEYLYYYLIPQFDDPADPKYFDKMLVVLIEPESRSFWNNATSATKKWYTHTAPKPTTPIKVDGYAHDMSPLVKGNAIEYLKECGFSYEAAEEVLVPYTVAYDTSSAYTSFSFGGGFALVSIVCFAIWIRKGMNFRD